MSVSPTFSGEVQFATYTDSSKAGPRITLRLQDRDELQAFIGMEGKRFMAVLVLIGDDEQPVPPPPASPEPEPEQPKGGVAAKWLALRCRELPFHLWLKSAWPNEWKQATYKDLSMTPENVAAECVRLVCGVKSRAEIDSDPQAAERFHRLRGHWQKHHLAVNA